MYYDDDEFSIRAKHVDETRGVDKFGRLEREFECHESGLFSCYVCMPPDWPLMLGQAEYDEWMSEGVGLCSICQTIACGVGNDETEHYCESCGQYTVSGA